MKLHDEIESMIIALKNWDGNKESLNEWLVDEFGNFQKNIDKEIPDSDLFHKALDESDKILGLLAQAGSKDEDFGEPFEYVKTAIEKLEQFKEKYL